ncbi:hypothetical protein QQS21_000726 [Conoideocrella luteorostrata]|uniref:2EXR domain-containing protein n=1 Tax=Conoideocrella luteorostrata TaxID=1105319 RepID=A0AAJ0CYC7_9HYPO|nr:hypothetical protein QQS21_000726 [Conoideocrella luteorostrata]
MDDILKKQGSTRPETHVAEDYGIVINGRQTISKLFRVNRESRNLARSFYRVHLHCWLMHGETIFKKPVKPGMLYFNPEQDYLHLANKFGMNPEVQDEDKIVEFLHQLKTTHDHHKIGVLHLAFDVADFTHRGSLFHQNPTTINQVYKASVIQILKQLRQVLFIQVQSSVAYGHGPTIVMAPVDV